MKNSFLTKPNYIRIYGHRGARGDIVENSIEGFKTMDNNSNNQGQNPNEVPTMIRPYVNLFDQKGNKLNVILISKPFSGDNQYSVYEANKKNNIFLS